MTFRLGDAAIFFSSNTSDLDRGFDRSESKAKGFGSKVAGVLGGVVAGAAAGAAAGIVAIGTAALSISADTEAAARKIEAQLGTTREEAERLAEAARGVFGSNFADSVQEAGQAVALLSQHMEDVVGQEQKLAEKAFGISDAFSEPIDEIIKAASNLQKEFDDLSPDQAFDLIASGFQRGLDKSGDFLDSLNEYGNVFSDSGFEADEFFSILESGQKGGTLGVDRVSDAVKEMGVRLSEGAKGISRSFDVMGMDFDAIRKKVAAGDAEWSDYFGAIVAGLQDIEDPLARQEAQIAIFGTMAEDLGNSFTDGLDPALIKLAEMEGAADSLSTQYETMGDKISGAWRRITVALSTVTDSAVDGINSLVDKFLPGLVDYIEDTAVPKLQELVDFIKDPEQKLKDFFDVPDGETLLTGLKDVWRTTKTNFSTWLRSTPQQISDFFKAPSTVITLTKLKLRWLILKRDFKAWLVSNAQTVSEFFSAPKREEMLADLKGVWSNVKGDFTSWLTTAGEKIGDYFDVPEKTGFVGALQVIWTGVRTDFTTWLTTSRAEDQGLF